MASRVRLLLVSVALLGLVAGCTHRGPVSTRPNGSGGASALPKNAASLRAEFPPVARRSAPGTPFTRLKPGAPFDAVLIVTTQVAHADIFPHTLNQGPVAYNPGGKLYRGQRAFILPFVSNYGFDALEHTDLTYEVSIRKPDGSLDGRPIGASLWQDSAAPDLILYPATVVNFYAEPGDPAGEYRIVVRITDHLVGETRELSHPIVLEDYAPPALPADFDPDAWFNRYYREPSPALALPALPRFFEKLPADKRAGAIPPLLGFYDQILSDNPWLLPAFAARLSAATPDEAYALSLVLGYHFRAASAPPAGVDAALWARITPFRAYAWPCDPDTPLLRAGQLDAAWGRFFASALYAPVQRLLEPLGYTADLGAAERWRKSLPPAEPGEAPPLPDLDDPATPVEVAREVMLRTALWSLRANARQHPLVRGYLEQALRAGDMAPGARALLERALRADAPAATPLASAKPGGS